MLQKNLQAARDALTAAEARMIEYQEAVDTYDQRLAQHQTDVEKFAAYGLPFPGEDEFGNSLWDDAWGSPPEPHPGDKGQDQARLDQARQAVEAARAEVVRLDPKPVERRRGRPSKHGEAPWGRKPSIYKAWENMKQRCSPNPSASSYADYYGRSIRICERWLTSYANFREDVFPIFEKTWKPGRKFDRIDNHGHYEPSNVEWRTDTKSNQNRRKPQ